MLKRNLIDYVCIALGALVMAVGINQFLVPVKLSIGGIGSIGTVLLYFLNIPIFATNIVLNLILFVLGYKVIGKHGMIKAAAGVLFLSLFLGLSAFLPVYSEDVLMCAIFGGLLCGVGVGLVIRSEGSTGGSDFAAVLLHKLFPHISVATMLLIVDVVIVAVSALVFQSITVMLYSFIALFVAAKVADLILTLGDIAKSVYILSEKHTEIAKWIQTELVRGVTGIYCKGMYANTDGTMLLCVVSPKQLPVLVHAIKQIDKSSFVIISDAREVHGEGFKM